MWRCSNCGTGIEDKYAHCWQCGAKNALKPTRQEPPPSQKAVPGFASYEELAKVPSRPIWLFRRGPLQRITWLLAIVILFKILSAPFLGTYGVYIVAGVAVIALIIILWGFFRRDPSEGVGIKLN
jgi:DNA-directed RNA polymerase subunit RPC12/RpoP